MIYLGIVFLIMMPISFISKYSMKTKRRNTRQRKIEKNLPYTPDAKYTETLGLKSIHLTEAQKELVNKIQDNTITFVEAPAGTGKTLAALYYAVNNYLVNHDDIVVIRTPVEANSDKIGFLPAGLEDKLEPHFASTKVILETLLSKGKVQTEMEKKIFFKIPNYCLGCTFSQSIVIIDEAQELSPLILKLLLERIGEYTKVIICGDPTQVYSHSTNRNGLTSAMKRFFETDTSNNLVRDADTHNLVPLYENICYHRFDISDVVRSEIVKTVLHAYTTNPL